MWQPKFCTETDEKLTGATRQIQKTNDGKRQKKPVPCRSPPAQHGCGFWCHENFDHNFPSLLNTDVMPEEYSVVEGGLCGVEFSKSVCGLLGGEI